MHSPLEQFEILPIFTLSRQATLYVTITNSTLFIVIIGVVTLLLLQLLNKQLHLIPTR